MSWPLIVVACRLGWLPDHGTPPHFVVMRGNDGAPLRDGRGRELFGLEQDVAWLVGKPNADRFAMASEKEPGALRILSIGESTTFGAGYHGEASYSRFLEARLKKQLGREAVEVVNCGKNGSDSSDFVTLAEELEPWSADAWVVYVGHNEFKKPALLGVWSESAARLARSEPLRCLFGDPVDEVPTAPMAQVGPFLTAEQRARGVRLFEEAVRALLEAGRSAGVPVFLCAPASNVVGLKPRLSTFAAAPGRTGPDGGARLEQELSLAAGWDQGELFDLARADADAAMRGRAEQQVAALAARLAAHPECALFHWRQGRILLALGRRAEGIAALRRSQATDGLPERASPDLLEVLRRLAREYAAHRVHLVDVEARLDRESTCGVPGYDLFFDNCHPNLFGHFLIADELLQAMAASGLLRSWSTDRAPADLAGVGSDESAGRTAGSAAIGLDPLRTLFSRICADLGISEADAAAHQIDQAKLQIANLGTRPVVAPAEWKLPSEFLKAAERQDPRLSTTHAEWNVLRGCCLAGMGDAEAASRHFTTAAKIDAPASAAVATKLSVLPGLVAALRAVNFEVTATGIRAIQR